MSYESIANIIGWFLTVSLLLMIGFTIGYVVALVRYDTEEYRGTDDE